MTILEAAAALRARKISSSELTTSALDRISAADPKVNAFVTVTADVARESARRADEELARGVDRGPLQGIPIALKDVFRTKGIRTTCGSSLFRDYVPDYDCAVAEKLSAAGAVLTGKTGMHELAYGVTSNNPHFGPVRNPWGLDRVPGGSSGGSGGAVAADMVFMAMGSDTGGSIRIPAAYCGVTGLKPTFGRVSRYGVMPLDFSLDHMGPLTRTARDAAVTLAAIAGADPRDDTSSARAVAEYLPPSQPSLNGLRIGMPENFYFERATARAVSSVEAMASLAQRLGAKLVAVRAPDIAALNALSRIILLAEASACMHDHLGRRELLGDDVRALFDQGRLITATDYIQAQRRRRMMRREFAALFEAIDCLFTPVTPTGAPRIGQMTLSVNGVDEDVRLASTRMVRGINVMGYPALSMPCGFDEEDLPLGLHIVGRPFEEALILRAAAALQDTTDFHTRTPPLV